MLAYPLAPAAFADGRTGNAKLGDVASLGGGKFVVVEPGEGPDGKMFNWLMLADIADATDIGAAAFNPDTADLELSSIDGEPVNGAQWAKVVAMKKTRLLDLNAIGWRVEKAEGLAVIDGHTLAITNDNDFGIKTRVYDSNGAEIDVDVTQIEVDAAGSILSGAPAGCTVRVARGDASESTLAIWVLRFDRALTSYKVS